MRSLSEEKRRQIVSGAREVFRTEGYGNASMGMIARQAGVSKGTLYNYFQSKDELFVEHVHERLSEYTQPIFHLPKERALRETLQAVGEAYVQLITSSDAEEIYRTAIAEARRFHAVAAALYETGPARAIERLAEYLDACERLGSIRLHDHSPREAASMFLTLIRDEHLLRRLLAQPNALRGRDIEGYVESKVTFFLRAIM